MNQKRIMLPGWEFVRPIGEGSFAEVYEIKRTDIFGNEEKSALKVITIPSSAAEISSYRENGYDDVSITTVFKNQVEEISKEFVLMNKLKGYTNIVSYEDNMVVPHDNGIGWDILIRMELLESLPNYMNKHFDFEAIDESMVLRIAEDMCRALELCEKHQIVHRDIKPSNIFVNKTGDFKLGDFGVAKTSDHTTRGAKTGTYAYMAPEVFNNKPYGARADIYSLGMVLYWLLNERRGPFEPLPPEIPRPSQKNRAMERRMNGEALPAPAHGSEALKAIILKACAFDPNERYRDAIEMLQALNGISDVSEETVIPEPVIEVASALVLEREDIVNVDETVGPFSEVTPVVTEDSVIEGTVGPFDRNPNVDTELLEEGTIGPFDDVLSDDTNGETVIPKPEPEPKPRKRKWSVLVAIAVVLVLVIGVGAYNKLGNLTDSDGVCREHEWVLATCTEPKQCSACGTIEGTANGHDTGETTCGHIPKCLVCGSLVGDAIPHVYSTISDTTKVCNECNAKCEMVYDLDDTVQIEVMYEDYVNGGFENISVKHKPTDSIITFVSNGETRKWIGNGPMYYANGTVYFHASEYYEPSDSWWTYLSKAAKKHYSFNEYWYDLYGYIWVMENDGRHKFDAALVVDVEGNPFVLIHDGDRSANPEKVIVEKASLKLKRK